MRTVPFPITITNQRSDGPQAMGSISPQSESILIIDFRKSDGSKGLSAVLVPAGTESPICYDADYVVYPIFFPAGDVDVTFAFHANIIDGINTTLAFITTRSIAGETITRVHGL